MTVRLFLVEDNPIIRESVTEALEELAPAKVIGWADDERSAADWLLAHPAECDLAVIDIFLRRGSGLGVLQATVGLPMRRVVMTNYATEEMRRRSLELGAARVFDKSADIDALVEYCRELDEGGFGASAGPGR
jgi:DNA-binding NarL/FixJ family response regulator